jgi:hypothetical protein
VLAIGAAVAVHFYERPAPANPPTPGVATTLTHSSSRDAASDGNTRTARLPPHEAPIYFEDATAQAGIRFRHTSGLSEHRYQPEADGSGVAILDFNGDGTLDLFFATCVPFPLDASRTVPHHVMYRRDADGVYEDVTDVSGVRLSSFGQGLAVGDFDNDGFTDLYLTNYGPNLLFQNNGDGTFRLVAGEATSSSDRWGAGCGFLDFDEDGDLDLYVANYAEWTTATHPFCGYEPRGIRTYCNPGVFKPDRHLLWRNQGDGTFTDATGEAGVLRSDGRGFGVVATDINGDGHIDLYVANDMTGNFLFLSKGDGTFDDVSSSSGAALAGDGATRASMGVDATDLDGDLLPELFVTNFWLEPNTLYRNLGGGQFLDVSDVSGLGSTSRLAMKWGAGLVDLDNDGWADVLVSNGHIDNNLDERRMEVPYAQRPHLWRNRTGMRFELVSDHAGAYFDETHVGRGIAFGDLDDDGRLDFVANNLDGPAAILMNRSSNENRWIRLELVGTAANRDAVGASVDIEAGPIRIRRQVKGGASYLSAHDQRLLIGVGPIETLAQVSVRWPSGRRTELHDVGTNRFYRLREPE